VEPGEPRFRMLETVRAYCAERLDETGERAAAEQAHAAYLLDLARTADPLLRGPDQLAWLRRLRADHENLVAAVRRSAAAGDLPTALRLFSALSSYWWLSGLRGEAAALAEEVLAAGEPPADLAEERAICMLSAAQGVLPPERHARYLEAAKSVMLSLPGPPRQPLVNVLWATTAGPPEGEAEAAELGRLVTADDPWTATLTMFGHGLIALHSGDTGQGEAALLGALDRFRALGERWGITMSLAELPRLARWRGHHDRVDELIDEALVATGELDSVDDTASLLCVRGGGRVRAGDLAAAVADFERAALLARRAGTPETLGAAGLGLAEIARLRGDLNAARRGCEQVLVDCPPGSFGAAETRAETFVALGRIAEARGDADEARRWHRRALVDADFRHNALHTTVAGAVEGLAGVALLDNDAARAALLLGAGAALRGAAIAGDPDVARVAQRARAAIGDEAYESQYARGVAMSRAEALAAAAVALRHG
jgi:tetratricopeptide (TPR) repeat protein